MIENQTKRNRATVRRYKARLSQRSGEMNFISLSKEMTASRLVACALTRVAADRRADYSRPAIHPCAPPHIHGSNPHSRTRTRRAGMLLYAHAYRFLDR